MFQLILPPDGSTEFNRLKYLVDMHIRSALNKRKDGKFVNTQKIAVRLLKDLKQLSKHSSSENIAELHEEVARLDVVEAFSMLQIMREAGIEVGNRTKVPLMVDDEELFFYAKRIKQFRELGTVCWGCNLPASYFKVEIPLHMYHRYEEARMQGRQMACNVNLYGLEEVNGENREILFTLDHVVPKSKGGDNSMANMQTLCRRCNLAKADKI